MQDAIIVLETPTHRESPRQLCRVAMPTLEPQLPTRALHTAHAGASAYDPIQVLRVGRTKPAASRPGLARLACAPARLTPAALRGIDPFVSDADPYPIHSPGLQLGPRSGRRRPRPLGPRLCAVCADAFTRRRPNRRLTEP
eukprot:2731268-Prymnesium_polylepis.1